MNKRILLFIEKVVLSTKLKQGYSLPNIIEDTEDIKKLIDVIENDPELFKMVYSVDPGYTNVKAVDIWNKIQADPTGREIIEKYPDAFGFRIASARSMGPGMEEGAYEQQNPEDPESTRPIDVYDKRANVSNQDIGSFYSFFTSNKLRPNEVSGGGTKEPPLE